MVKGCGPFYNRYMPNYFTPELLEWLLEGDVSIQYMVRRHLLKENAEILNDLRERIPREGWGLEILGRQRSDGDWGRAYYQPKWTSTHYTLLELMYLGIPPDTAGPRLAVERTIDRFLGEDGGLYFTMDGKITDDCVGAMFLQTAVYFSKDFSTDTEPLERMADHLLGRMMPDGAWNCRSARSRAIHSSVHTTISCLEAFRLFRERCPTYRQDKVKDAVESAEEFLLKHELCKSHRTGEVMDDRMLKISWPTRWYFDILRGLEYFADAGLTRDDRLEWSMKVLMSKRRRDGRWPVQNRHPGESHVLMEKTGSPSRWNTFRALKVLKAFDVVM